MPGARPAVQNRSQRTAERILLATEELLATRFIEETSVAQIARRAGVAVGSVYRRFEGKDALVPCLYERYVARLGELIERELDPTLWTDLELRQRVERLVALTIKHYRSQRGLLRAIVDPKRTIPARRSGEPAPLTTVLLQRCHQLLLACKDEIESQQPERTVELGFYLMYATARDRILYPRAPQFEEVADPGHGLERELSHALHAYLATPRSEN